MSNTNCACNCAPCACPSPRGEGCVPDLCVPRPCFFNGQLITSDDLNAIVSHFRARDLMFGRFVGGWGIYGGLVVDAAPGLPHERLGRERHLSPNPQIIAGTTVQVSAGVAIDALGRSLVQCAPTILDLSAMAAQLPSAPGSHSCAEWLEGSAPPVYGGYDPRDSVRLNTPVPSQYQTHITATEYWLVAEYDETPMRPAAQFSGGGACDPAPTCDFTRKRELVRYALIPPPASAEQYKFTGCLEVTELPDLDRGREDRASSDHSNGGRDDDGGRGSNGGSDDARVRETYEIVDALNSALAGACCSRPAVVLARVLFLSAPGNLQGALPNAPVYTILDDAYPLRRIAASAALNLFATASRGDGGRGGGGPIAQARITGANRDTTAVAGYGVQRATRRETASGIHYEVALVERRSVEHRVVHATPHHSESATPRFVHLAPLIVDGGGDTILVRFLDRDGKSVEVDGFGLSVFDAQQGGGS